jgi:P2-related tail formation protein
MTMSKTKKYESKTSFLLTGERGTVNALRKHVKSLPVPRNLNEWLIEAGVERMQREIKERESQQI